MAHKKLTLYYFMEKNDDNDELFLFLFLFFLSIEIIYNYYNSRPSERYICIQSKGLFLSLISSTYLLQM